MLALSLVKELEIIGEAAGRVTEETKSEASMVPWSPETCLHSWNS